MGEASLSSNALYAARPTVRINGTEQERVNGLLTAIEMNEREDGLSTLEMKLANIASDPAGNADYAFEDEATFKLGDTITNIVVNPHVVLIKIDFGLLGFGARIGGNGLREVEEPDLRLIIVTSDARRVRHRKRVTALDSGQNRLELRDK